MTNYEYVQKTIDIFEDSLGSARVIATASELAGKIGYSVHHLNRLFQLLCGDSLGRYILKRRLAEAVCAVRGGVLPSQVYALYGWEDYSAFSRSVRKEFGVAPSKLSELDAAALSLTYRARPVLSSVQTQHPLDPVLLQTRSIHATGLVFFMDNNVKGFHKSWRIFSDNRHKIRDVKGNVTYQFSCWDENASPENDGLWIFCAAETDSTVDQDMMFFSKTYPPLRILSFKHTGPVETIHDTYRRIYEEFIMNSKYKLTGNYEYQKYGEDGSIEICIPVCG